MNGQTEVVAEAFSRTAERYDAYAQDHPHLSRLRGKVYTHLERFVPAGARILELNAGTGTDAAELARRGFSVHATDISPGMLARARDKASRTEIAGRMTVQACSFTELDKMVGGPYDAVFSDLGGLNCVPDLSVTIRQLPQLLKPGGIVTWVLMPPICLWEMAEIFRGHPRLAFRRLAKHGTRSHLEGLFFGVYYFTPRQVIRWFGPGYDLLAVEGLAVLTPTAESKNFIRFHPHLYQALAWLDDRLAARPPWRGWGDFFILTLRLRK